MDTNELLRLKEELVTGKKTPKEIGNVLFQKERKSWHTKEWKEKRKKILKDECEQCGKNENLLIQHFWHPMKYNDVFDIMKNKYRTIWREENQIDDVINNQDIIEHFNKIKKEIEEIKDVCPNCFSANVRARKTVQPKYKCGLCKAEFNEKLKKEIPILYDDLDTEGTPLRKNASVFVLSELKESLYYKRSNELYWESYSSKIYSETILRIIDEYIKYISLEDTATFCKKCAFLWDKRNQDLCSDCRENYKSRHIDKCYNCFEKKKKEPTKKEMASSDI